MLDFIQSLKQNWLPETKPATGHNNHGEAITYTLYFDVFRCEWTSRKRAFQGYVFKHVNEMIQQSDTPDFN